MRLMRERCQSTRSCWNCVREELECMVISSGSRSKRLSSSISMEVVAEVRDEGQKQDNSSEKTGRGCREGIMLVVETSKPGDWPSLLTRQPEDVVEKGWKHLRTVGIYLMTQETSLQTRVRYVRSSLIQQQQMFCKCI